jgi:hypothetical protein
MPFPAAGEHVCDPIFIHHVHFSEHTGFSHLGGYLWFDECRIPTSMAYHYNKLK